MGYRDPGACGSCVCGSLEAGAGALMPQSTERFRHEDIASVPAGWKVRTVTTSGGHRVRVAFPPGRRVKGAGRVVGILHPLTGNNPCGNPCSLRSSNPAELMAMNVANPPKRRGGESKQGVLAYGTGFNHGLRGKK